jgi:hypothetical protein
VPSSDSEAVSEAVALTSVSAAKLSHDTARVMVPPTEATLRRSSRPCDDERRVVVLPAKHAL